MLTFGDALAFLKQGKSVTRSGWNGKGMWLKLQVPDAHSKMTLPYIFMKTATNDLVPWLASQTDIRRLDALHISASGLRLIAQSEGCYLTAYKCPAGVLTIGYGHTSAAGAPEVHPGQKITQDEATAILKNDVEQFDHYVTESVKVKLAQHEFDALSSFVFNVGPGNFRKSTLLKKLNKGDKACRAG
jgi:GH24 family phage-related lysozyme (muramidase)